MKKSLKHKEVKAEEWHYAVMRSVFGDYWIGKTKLPLKKEIIFVDIRDAIEKAKNLFLEDHLEFDVDAFEKNEEINNIEDEQAYRDIIETTNEVDEISDQIEIRDLL